MAPAISQATARLKRVFGKSEDWIAHGSMTRSSPAIFSAMSQTSPARKREPTSSSCNERPGPSRAPVNGRFAVRSGPARYCQTLVPLALPTLLVAVIVALLAAGASTSIEAVVSPPVVIVALHDVSVTPDATTVLRDAPSQFVM